MRTTHRPRLAGMIVTGLAALALAAGCGTAADSPDTAGSPPPGPQMSPVPSDAAYSAADVVFAQELLVHLKQAVEMSTLAETKAGAVKVKQLAAKAKKEREPAMEVITRWLTDHGQPVPTPSPTAGQGGGTGLANEQEMKTLAGVKGEPFDRLYLQMLIINVEACKTLLNGQQWSGKDPNMMSLAHDVSADQEAEVVQARRLLGR